MENFWPPLGTSDLPVSLQIWYLCTLHTQITISLLFSLDPFLTADLAFITVIYVFARKIDVITLIRGPRIIFLLTII